MNTEPWPPNLVGRTCDPTDGVEGHAGVIWGQPEGNCPENVVNVALALEHKNKLAKNIIASAYNVHRCSSS